jgi:tetratricopeptide (TPR) repeat protein
MWAKNFEESIAWAEKALARNPRALPPRRIMVVGLVGIGQRDKAAAIVQEILKLDPRFTIAGWRLRNPSSLRDEAHWKYMIDAYRAAGVPE